MIVPMSKVTVLVLATDRDAALERLRDLGVIHLEAIRPAETEDVETARREWEHVQQVLEVLPRTAQGQPTGQPAEVIVRRVWEILHRRNDIADRLEELRYEADRIRPFGHVDQPRCADSPNEVSTCAGTVQALGRSFGFPMGSSGWRWPATNRRCTSP